MGQVKISDALLVTWKAVTLANAKIVFELIFVPLWDAGSSRWFSGCFCWRTFINRSISIEMELQFIVAFSHSIMGEVRSQCCRDTTSARLILSSTGLTAGFIV